MARGACTSIASSEFSLLRRRIDNRFASPNQKVARLQHGPGYFVQPLRKIEIAHEFFRKSFENPVLNRALVRPPAFVIPIAPVYLIFPKDEMRLALRVAPVGRIEGKSAPPAIEAPCLTDPSVKVENQIVSATTRTAN